MSESDPVPPSAVELRPAFEFTCEECGRNAFLPAVSRLLSHEETRRFLVEVGDLEEWQQLPDGVRLERTELPPKAKCPHCGTDFKVLKA